MVKYLRFKNQQSGQVNWTYKSIDQISHFLYQPKSRIQRICKLIELHLHRLLFEACESSTMDFSDAKNCMATHGRSARAAMDFLRDIPDIRIDNSKSETAHYVYGSDPYLLGEDWPRSSVSVSDAVRRPYRRPRPSRARSGSDVGPPLPAAAASDPFGNHRSRNAARSPTPSEKKAAEITTTIPFTTPNKVPKMRPSGSSPEPALCATIT